MTNPIIGQITSPQNIDGTPSSICTTGLQVNVVTGIFLWSLRHLFSKPEYIATESLKKYIWNKDSTLTNIIIESLTSWTPSNIQALQSRPAILVKRGPWAPVKLGFGDKYIDNPDEINNNSIKHEILIGGSHLIFCLGGRGEESDAIANEVFYYLLEFGQVIRQDYGFNRFTIQGMGPMVKLEEAHEHLGTPITVEYAFNHAWTITERALTLKGISLNIE